MTKPNPSSYFWAAALLFCLSSWGCTNPEETTVVVDPPTEQPKTFTNPVYNVGPDPWVIQHDSTYYVTYTTGRNITLIATKRMSELNTGNAQARVVWTPPATGFNSKEIWAPELHRINGVWYVYYAASDGENRNHRMWVLANDNLDPLTDNWEDLGELELPDDKWAIDGSPVEIGGQRYFAWSGWEGDVNVRQLIYLAEMETPTRVVGDRVKILEPTENWEKNNVSPEVTEGPQFLQRGDFVFLFYSAGGCWTDGYSIGALWMDKNADPMLAESWSRIDTNPLFVSNASAQAYGPGHNSFFTSRDGTEDWILYHANPRQGMGCGDDRSIRMQKITYAPNGFPLLGQPAALGQRIPVPAGE
ncbi:glycoside hydrolase family 43 protein [Neolewinella lacunae]|uniref:Glycoside hydrolase family 43 protein n=1 Tax=Neolewinella lacunae TaxID=1517758 RepID=A0A923PJA7_9BACT|nr:glycoside hydrolase family 43 protein [Neolewinella lacunae]MBC6995117.1 glycoside hydrolase family 43 protein [Neolewinella lacunae]MDN3634067.1 glycoside hydrolase family 43 protein [Neolewinella lacunae]